jgi:hypothetical protein
MTFPDNGWWRLAVAVLATWRITHLLAKEDGPAQAIVRIRARLGSGFVGQLADCFQCLSLWVAAPVAFFVNRSPSGLPITWLALSGAACLLERIAPEPASIQPIFDTVEGDPNDGMLWSESSESRQPADPDGGAPQAAIGAT